MYGFYEGFEWVRSKVEGSSHDALVNAHQVIHAEKVLHLFREARVEHWILPCAPACRVATTPAVERAAIRFWSVYYGFMHFAVRHGFPREPLMRFALRVMANLTRGEHGDATDRLMHALMSAAPSVVAGGAG